MVGGGSAVGASVDGDNDGWQQMIGPDGGSGGCLSEKNSKFFFVPNELRSPKNNMSSFCFIHIWGMGGWVSPNMDISIFLLTLP